MLEELEAAQAAKEAAEVVASLSLVEATTLTTADPEPVDKEQQVGDGGNGGWPVVGWLWSAVTSPFAPKQPQPQQEERAPPQPLPSLPLPSTAPSVRINDGDGDNIGTTPDAAAMAELASSATEQQENGQGAWGAVDWLWGAAVGSVQGLLAAKQREEEGQPAAAAVGLLLPPSGEGERAGPPPQVALEGGRVERGIRVSEKGASVFVVRLSCLALLLYPRLASYYHCPSQTSFNQMLPSQQEDGGSSSGADIVPTAGGGEGPGVELYERREATATLGGNSGDSSKKWSLNLALDVSLRFFLRRPQRNDTDTGGGDQEQQPSLPMTPTRARELEERGWAVRGEEPPPPVLQRMRERREAMLAAGLDSGEEEEGEEAGAKRGGLFGWAGAVADGAWGVVSGRWLRGDGKEAQQVQAGAPPSLPRSSSSRGASVGGMVTGQGLHGVAGVGGSLIPPPAPAPAPEPAASAPAAPEKQTVRPGKQQPPTPKAAAPRTATPLSPTAAAAATEALLQQDASVSALSPRDRKRDKFRRFLAAILHLPALGTQRARQARASSKSSSAVKRSELVRGLGLTEAEMAGAKTTRAFGGIGLAPDLVGPLALRPLGKRERARWVGGWIAGEKARVCSSVWGPGRAHTA